MIVPVSGLHTNDRVRGLGLIVENVAEMPEEYLRVSGRVTAKDGTAYPASIVLPATHNVRIARPFEPGDRVTVPVSYVVEAYAAEAALALLESPYVEVEVDEVRPDERQIVVFDPNSSEPLEERERFAVPFRSARHAVPTA